MAKKDTLVSEKCENEDGTNPSDSTENPRFKYKLKRNSCRRNNTYKSKSSHKTTKKPGKFQAGMNMLEDIFKNIDEQTENEKKSKIQLEPVKKRKTQIEQFQNQEKRSKFKTQHNTEKLFYSTVQKKAGQLNQINTVSKKDSDLNKFDIETLPVEEPEGLVHLRNALKIHEGINLELNQRRFTRRLSIGPGIGMYKAQISDDLFQDILMKTGGNVDKAIHAHVYHRGGLDYKSDLNSQTSPSTKKLGRRHSISDVQYLDKNSKGKNTDEVSGNFNTEVLPNLVKRNSVDLLRKTLLGFNKMKSDCLSNLNYDNELVQIGKLAIEESLIPEDTETRYSGVGKIVEFTKFELQRVNSGIIETDERRSSVQFRESQSSHRSNVDTKIPDFRPMRKPKHTSDRSIFLKNNTLDNSNKKN